MSYCLRMFASTITELLQNDVKWVSIQIRMRLLPHIFVGKTLMRIRACCRVIYQVGKKKSTLELFQQEMPTYKHENICLKCWQFYSLFICPEQLNRWPCPLLWHHLQPDTTCPLRLVIFETFCKLCLFSTFFTSWTYLHVVLIYKLYFLHECFFTS